MTPQKKEGWHLNFLSWGCDSENVRYVLSYFVCCINACRYADMLWFSKHILSYQKNFVTINVCVNTNYMVIVVRCDIPTVVMLLQQIQVFLVVLTGEYLPVFRMVIRSKQWTARPWSWWNCVTTEQTCIFMIIVLFSLNYCCADSLRCQRITTSKTRSGILMLCSNPNNTLLVMRMTHFSFQVIFCIVCSFCNWSHVEPSSETTWETQA